MNSQHQLFEFNWMGWNESLQMMPESIDCSDEVMDAIAIGVQDPIREIVVIRRPICSELWTIIED